MTIPAHPNPQTLLAQLIASDPDAAELVARFPAAGDPRHLAATLSLWQHVAEHAPACSVLADCWITADAGPTGVGVDALAVSIDHPDRTQPVQLVRYVDAHRLTPDPTSAGPAAAAASIEVLAGAVADLDRAAAALVDPDTVLRADPLHPTPPPLPAPQPAPPAWSLR